MILISVELNQIITVIIFPTVLCHVLDGGIGSVQSIQLVYSLIRLLSWMIKAWNVYRYFPTKLVFSVLFEFSWVALDMRLVDESLVLKFTVDKSFVLDKRLVPVYFG